MSVRNSSFHAYHLLGQEKFEQAAAEFKGCIAENPSDVKSMIGLARSYLGLGHSQLASELYKKVLSECNSGPETTARLEAQLFFGHLDNAIQGKAGVEKDAEYHFFMALAYYLRGHLNDCMEWMEIAAEQEEVWCEEDPKDPLLYHLLSDVEYRDLEHIYLDALEHISGKGGPPQNRWFSICMPSYELFLAKTNPEQERFITRLLQTVSSGITEHDDHSGKNILHQLISDLDKRGLQKFAHQAADYLEKDQVARLAELVLGLELDHLLQFSECFALSPQAVQDSNLQKLIEVLPYRMAVGLAFLYTAAHPIQGIGKRLAVKLNNDTIARLIAASFIGFYQEISHYRTNGK